QNIVFIISKLITTNLRRTAPFRKANIFSWDMFQTYVWSIDIYFFWCQHFFSYGTDFIQCSYPPPLRHTVHNFGMLMVGEAQVYKPLFIQPLGRLFQQFDLLSVVFDQVVI